MKVANAIAQRIIRGHLGRVAFLARQLLQRTLRELRLTSAPKIQRAARGYIDRAMVFRMHELKARQFEAALTLQLLWYRHLDNYSTFVLLGCLRVTDAIERDFNKLIKKFSRKHMARLISYEYRRHRDRRGRCGRGR